MRQVILASQSRARKLLMDSLGIPFTIIPAKIDEKAIRDKDLKKRAVNIATKKAETISEKYPDAIVIAADTFSESNGKVFEKPINEKEAYEMLSKLSGKSAKNFTGVCYIDRKNKIFIKKTIVSRYYFRKLYDNELNDYVKTYPVTEWAAGFALMEPYILSFLRRVSGSFTGVSHGLPMEFIIPLLKKSGFEPQPHEGMGYCKK